MYFIALSIVAVLWQMCHRLDDVRAGRQSTPPKKILVSLLTCALPPNPLAWACPGHPRLRYAAATGKTWVAGTGPATGRLSLAELKRPRRSEQEERHQDQDDDDRQQRDLDEPGKPEPGAAVPFEFWVNRRHHRLVRPEIPTRDIAKPQREASAGRPHGTGFSAASSGAMAPATMTRLPSILSRPSA